MVTRTSDLGNAASQKHGMYHWGRWLFRLNLFALMFFSTIIHAQAKDPGQKVTLSGKNLPLTSVFSSIERQTGLSFFFNEGLIRGTKPVNLDLKDVPVETALHETLKETQLDFYRTGKTIFIVKKAIEITLSGSNPDHGSSTVDLKGRVLNEQGESLPGATVTVKGTSRATLTDERGEFELKGLTPGVLIEVSYLGYQNKQLEAKNADLGIIRMSITTNRLDEAQVIAYGKTSERFSTGDITTVRSADIEKQPINNPLLALEGRVPGLFISQTTGFSGTGLKVQIMGQNSISKGNDPLYVVDGIPYPSQPIASISLVQGGSGLSSPSPLAFLNPGDIESVSILKDADATAIYGSRAANGAILITTKRGRPGKTSININLQNGIGRDARRIKLLNREQYLSMRREAFMNDGLGTFGATDYDVNGTYDSSRYTDWQKVLLGGTAQYSDLQGDISGGSGNTQFLVGAGYHRETTVFSNKFSDQKGSMHFNLRNSSANQKFTMQFSGEYMIDENRLPQTDITGIALFLAPDAPKLYNPDGTLNWAPAKSGNSSWTNPLASFNYYSNVKTSNLVANASLVYELLSCLSLKTSFGYTNLETNEILKSSTLAIAPENRASASKFSTFSNTNVNSWIVEPQIIFSHLVARGKLEIVSGMTIYQNNSFGQTLSAKGFNSDQQLGDIGAATSVTGATTAASIYKYNAGFGRINYNWANQWILNLTARRDGSSRFGTNDQFHNFGSAAVAWIFSETKLIRKMMRVLSFGKLSGSYGTTGSDQIGDYKFLSLYGATNVPIAYQGISGLLPNGLANPYLQWEETRKLRGAISIGLLKDRVVVSAAYFRNRSSNQLLSYALPTITGFGLIAKNFPATVQNAGWEFAANATIFKSVKFSWSGAINLTIPRNELVAFSGLANSSYSGSLIIGQPVTVNKVNPFLGTNPATGIYQVGDFHGNPTMTPGANDLTVFKTSDPKAYGGVQNTFTYAGWQLDVFFQFVKQMASNFYGRIGDFPGEFSASGPIGNQPAFVLNRWRKSGDASAIQRFSTQALQFNNARFSEVAWSDASYARLKNVSLSYQFPDAWKRRMHVQSFRLYAQAQNLLTITKYTGLDPETASSFILPPLRVVTIGLQMGL